MPRQEYNAEESDKRPYEPEVDEWICDNLKTERNLAKLFAEKIGSCKSWQREVRTHFVSCKRETDIFIEYQCQQGEQIILAFIENKINAGFGKGQPEGYESRARKAEKDEENTTAYTIIFAPERYINNRKGVEVFDKQITYEDAIKTLRKETLETLGKETAKTLGAKGVCCSQTLADRLQKCINAPGYMRGADTYTSAMADLIREICKEKEFRELIIREDANEGRPIRNLRMFFKAEKFSKTKFEFVYKAKSHGSVDLQFPNINPECLKKKVGDILQIKKAGESTSTCVVNLIPMKKEDEKSASIRIGVPCINPSSHNDQTEKIRKGLREAIVLSELLKLCEEKFLAIVKECEDKKKKTGLS